MPKILPAILLLLASVALGAQVLSDRPFAAEMAQALELEAGATATDIPHHVHYELKLYDRRHKLTTGTWDIWRDPQHYVRTDIAAGDFHSVDIEDLAQHTQWRHFDRVLPLKLFDLRQNYDQPAVAVAFFSNPSLAPNARVTFQQIDGSPFDCTAESLQIRICFDPIAHVLAFAQIMNQTMTWENWQTVGRHSIPQRFRIYDGNRLIVEASGKVDVVKTFPPDLFIVPPGEPDMGDPEDNGSAPHRVIAAKSLEPDLLYGNVLMHLFVGPDGKVKKAELIDADDDSLIGDAKHFARNVKFAPQVTKGVAVPFDEYLYIQHSLNFQ